MKQRITIMIDDAVLKKLRLNQAKKIQKENRSVSMSEIISESLKDAV
jgi:hypothetical protein